MIDNGKINIIDEVIDVNDRGLAYGDGIFETIAYVNGALHNWPLHWERLNLGAKKLNLEIPDEKLLLKTIDLKLNNDSVNKVIKIIISRGKGGRGYLFPEQTKSSLIITIHHWPDRAVDDYRSGIRVKICQTCLAQQPALAGIKHLNRLEQVLARNEFSDSDFNDCIMLACSDNTSVFNARVVEATSSNLFFVKKGQLFTPKIDTCGVQGTIRQEIFHLAKKMSLKLELGHYILSDLKDASEVFLTNSIFGIVPVASITCNDKMQWKYSQQAQSRICVSLSNIINKSLTRPELL